MVKKSDDAGVVSMHAAWQEATDALLRARDSGLEEDKAAAVKKLYKVAVMKARLHIKGSVDLLLPFRARRSADAMARQVVGSIMTKGGRVSLLIDTFDADKGTLEQLLAAHIRNKVIDHLRKDRRRGLIGSTTHDAADTEPDVWAQECSLLTLPPPDGPRDQRGLSEASYTSGFEAVEAREIIAQVEAILDPDEREVMHYRLAGYDAKEAIAAMNAEHPVEEDAFGKACEYMTEKKHRLRLESAHKKLFKAFPDMQPPGLRN